MKTKNLPRGDLRYLVGAAALVVVAVALALAFGIVRPPALSTLTADAAPSLSIAWTEYNEREGCTDLMVARPDGEAESIACSATLVRVIGWTKDGIITVSNDEGIESLDIRNPSMGEVLSTRGVFGYDQKPPEEGVFTTERKDGVLVIVDRRGGSIWEVEADTRYEIGMIEGSPDGLWVALTDSAERLLVVPADGSAAPVVWATGVNEWAWIDLVWEGAELPD